MYTCKTAPLPFDFHCIICFEALHPELRPPVILPCGHTFLCAPCSKRINRCMECRTSLFFTPPSDPTPDAAPTLAPWSDRSRRGAYTRSPRPPSPSVKQKPKEQIPYPLPKNLLLISLMESAQMEAAAKRGKDQSKKKKAEKQLASAELMQLKTVASNASESSTEVILSSGKIIPENIAPLELTYSQKAASYDEDAYIFSSSDEESEMDEDFDDDDERVMTAIGTISSTCGTYAVADRNGLLVLPRKPKDVGERESNYGSRLNPHIPILSSSSNSPKHFTPTSSPKRVDSAEKSPCPLERTYSNKPLPFQLDFGSKVQVVSIKDGWATLARNGGYLYVETSQLVKVSGPEDKACEIEGMLVNLNETRRDIEKRNQLLNTVENNLVEKLQKALRKPLPVFAPPQNVLDEDQKLEEETERKKRMDALHLASPKPAKSPPDDLPDLGGLKIDTSESSHHLALPHLSPSQASSLPSSPHSSHSHHSPHSPARVAVNNLPRQSPVRQSPYRDRRRSLPSPTSPNSQRVDFRTGLSGHHALSRSNSQARNTYHRSSARLYGEHRGVASSGWRMIRRLGSSDTESRKESTRANTS